MFNPLKLKKISHAILAVAAFSAVVCSSLYLPPVENLFNPSLVSLKQQGKKALKELRKGELYLPKSVLVLRPQKKLYRYSKRNNAIYAPENQSIDVYENFYLDGLTGNTSLVSGLFFFSPPNKASPNL